MKQFILAAALMGVALGGVAYASDIKIGYVDLRRVLTESKAGQRVKADLEKSVASRKAALAKDEEKLKAMQDAFEKDKLLLSEAKKKEKQKQFQQKLQAYQKSAGEAQREISQKENEFTAKALPEVRVIVREIAKEDKLTLVFEKNQMPVLYAVDGPDLTDKVLQRYDAKGAK